MAEKGKKVRATHTQKRKRPPEHGSPKLITAAQYNAMWDAYCEVQTAAHVRRKVGVSQEAATSYVFGPGRPQDGMEPLRDRWLRVQAAAQEEQELTILDLRREEMGWARKQLTAIHGEMELALADVRRRVENFRKQGKGGVPERELKLESIVNSFDKAVRTAEHLLGGPDVSVGQTGFDPLDTLTEEEALVYVRTGALPASVRNAVGTVQKAKK